MKPRCYLTVLAVLFFSGCAAPPPINRNPSPVINAGSGGQQFSEEGQKSKFYTSPDDPWAGIRTGRCAVPFRLWLFKDGTAKCWWGSSPAGCRGMGASEKIYPYEFITENGQIVVIIHGEISTSRCTLQG